MLVKYIETRYIHQYWGTIEPFIQKALEYTDDLNVDQAKVLITSGAWLVIIAIEDEKITGVATVSFENGINFKTAFITCIAGKGIINKVAFKEFVDILKLYGTTRIQGHARDSLVKLYKSFGISKKTNLVEIKL